MNKWILENLFHYFQGEDGLVYYREPVDGQGWIVCWPEQDTYTHTYRFPPDIWGVPLDNQP
jgi:hypothetical protein